MKKKIANMLNPVFVFVKKHSIGTVVVALLITAVIVALACKDTTEVAPGDKNAVSDVSTSSSEGNVSQDAGSSEEQEPVSSQEDASSEGAASTDSTTSKTEASESSSKQEAVQKPKEEVKKEKIYQLT